MNKLAIIGTIAAIILTIFASIQMANLKFTSITSAKTVKKPVIEEMTGKILFVSDRDGNHEIYMMDLGTKEITNLTKSLADDMNPQISPDKKYIVFYSDRDGNNQVYRMYLKDHSVEKLTNNNAQNYDPSYSPDGKYIVYKSNIDDQLGDIFIMNEDGSNTHNLTVTRNSTEEWNPKFTADGKTIIFCSRSNKDPMTDELMETNIGGNTPKQITFNHVADWYASINPVKNSLAFISKTDSRNPDDIYTSTLDGKNRMQLTTQPGNDADPSWDNTGDKLIFINDQDGDYDLYIMNADGSNIEKIVDTNSNELSPVFLTQ